MAKFQDSRFPWALLVFVSVALVIIAHSLFQNYAYMPPCEQCVYIRFAFLCMALGGVIAIINPKNLLFALVGYLFAFWGAVQGIMYSVKLAKIHDAVHGDDPFGVQGCSSHTIHLACHLSSGRLTGLCQRVIVAMTALWCLMVRC